MIFFLIFRWTKALTDTVMEISVPLALEYGTGKMQVQRAQVT